MFRKRAILTGLILIIGACGAPDDGGGSVEAALAAHVDGIEQSDDLRRVWARAGDYSTPSPDGRYVAFVDWSTGDVAMHDLTTGEDTRLTDKGSWTDDGSWAEEPLFSPDGRQVAYAYGNAKDRGDDWRYELRRVDVGDTRQHMIYALDVEDEWIAPMDWSAERGIAVEVDRADGSSELALIQPESGELQVLARFGKDEAHPHDAAFSPDDRYLAYRRGEDVYVRDLAGGIETSLDSPTRALLGWTPDGGSLLVHTSHQAATGIWAVPVESGRQAAEPLLVEPGLPALTPGGFAGDRYFYNIVTEAPRVYRATVDPAEGRLLAEPVALTSPIDGRSGHPAWSPDGMSLAYTLERPHGDDLRFMVMATDGDAVREIARGDFRSGAVKGLRWAEGGESLIFLAVVDGKGPSLFRIDVRSGEISRETGPRRAGPTIDVSRAGESVLLLDRSEVGKVDEKELMARNLASQAEQVVANLPAEREYGALALAPDGRRAAIVYRGPERKTSGIRLITLDTGSSRDAFEVAHPVHLELAHSPLAWAPDGRHLLAVRGEWEAPGSHALISVPIDGGEPMTLMPRLVRHLALHPDGRRLAFSGGEARTELWVMDDVTDAVNEAKQRRSSSSANDG